MARRVILDFTDTFRQTYRNLAEPVQEELQKVLRSLVKLTCSEGEELLKPQAPGP